MNIIANILGLKRRDYVIIRIVLMAIIYLIIFKYIDLLKYFVLIIFGVTLFAYSREKSKVSGELDSFEDDNLFFRYGTKISGSSFPLRFTKQMTNIETEQIIFNLKEHLALIIKQEIDHKISKGIHSTEIVNIVDRNMRNDERLFLRFWYKGIRGGEISHFILFEHIGSYIIIHLDSYLKGIPHWYDKIDFLFKSPYKIWFWFIPWLRNDYSILTVISKYLDNSFESYDINSYYIASQYSILDSIKEYLKKQGLLSNELESIINYQLIFNNNVAGNQVNMSGNNNTISSIVQKII